MEKITWMTSCYIKNLWAEKYFGLKTGQKNINLFFDVGYGQLNFREYNQELHLGTTLSLLEQYLSKVYGKNYLNDELLLIKLQP